MKIYRCITFLFLLALIQGCSYKSWHQSMKMMERNKCEKMMDPDRQSCLESLDYTFEEYQRETQPQDKSKGVIN